MTTTVVGDRITIELPVRLAGGGNTRDGHWRQRHTRTRAERLLALSHVADALRRLGPEAKLRAAHVYLTRCAPRPLDDDNLRPYFKAMRDGVASAFGVDDSTTSRVSFEYRQEFKSKKYTRNPYLVRIDIRLIDSAKAL